MKRNVIILQSHRSAILFPKIIEMSQFLELNFPEYNINQDVGHSSSYKEDFCVCCLAQNVSFINLKTCKHAEFFQCLLSFKTNLPMKLVCRQCHSLLKNFTEFKQTVEDNITYLNNLTSNVKLNKTVPKLKHTPISIYSTVNPHIEIPIEIEIKDELTNHNPDILTDQEEEIDSTNQVYDIEIKIEKKDNSETELLSSECREKKAKKAKRKGVQNQPKLQEKYLGKVKAITLAKDEYILEREVERTKETYLKLLYRCDWCVVGYDHEVTLQEHNEKRHTKKKGSIVCDLCQCVLNTKASYREHYRRHFRRYECESCSKRYNTLSAAEEHYKERHGEIRSLFTCTVCDFTTDSNRKYRYHRDKHKDKRQCTLCGTTFVNNTGLKVHMLNRHKLSKRTYACKSCDKVYGTKSGLSSHAQSAHGAGGGYCVPCNTHFRTPGTYKTHLKTHSRHVSLSDKKFSCDECSSKFLSARALHAHVEWAHRHNPGQHCDKCHKVFKTARTLQRHKDFVHDKKQMPKNKICDHCGRGFTTLTILRAHIRTHTGERPLRCLRCPAAFAHPAALYTHNKLLHSAGKT